jgi:hypothetical protein
MLFPSILDGDPKATRSTGPAKNVPTASAQLQTFTISLHPVRMAALQKVTFDPRSGRPIAPLWWRLTTFYVVYGWLTAAIMIWLAYLGVRDGRPDLSAVSGGAAAIIVFYVHWERRRVQRKRRRFDEQVAAYERVISKPI